ncbi:MAG: GNAT family N-acetyltransferase [Lachnospiraceae bacterium]|nr:GNAT family N-acetyltransferase [Lachnospiraceae bacterium]
MVFAGNVADMFSDLSSGKEPDFKSYYSSDIMHMGFGFNGFDETDENNLVFTQITKDNAKSFSALIPEDFSERIEASLPGEFGVGALEARDGKYVPLGVIAFCMHNDYAKYITVSWFYVAKEARKKGVGKALLKDVIRILEECDAESIVWDMPATEKMRETALFLEEIGFTFTYEVAEKFETTVSAFAANKLLADFTPIPRIRPLKDVEPLIVKKGLQVILDQLNDLNPAELMAIDLSWYDGKISSVLMDGDRVSALLLTHLCPSGKLQVLLMGGLKKVDPKDFILLIRTSLKAVMEESKSDGRIEILFRREASIDLMDKFFPNHKVELVIRAAYMVEDFL